MARFDDFTQQEKRVIREAITGAQSEFYDPGHTQEDRETLEALIREIEDADLPFTFGEPTGPDAGDGIRVTVEPRPVTVAVKPAVIRVTAGKPQEPAQRGRWDAPTPSEALEPTRTQTTPRGPTEAANGYKGFLFIECAQCGDVHAFCAKQPITTYRCAKCGGRTPLVNMPRLRVMCECGCRYSYRTNVVTQQMDVNCFKCGSPVAVEWVERRWQYETIGWAESRKKGGRRK